MKEKSITVQSAQSKKKGVTNGKAWEIFKIVDQDGVKYDTFEKQLAQLGITARISYDEKERDWEKSPGKIIKVTDRTIRRFEVGAEFGGSIPPLTREESLTGQGGAISGVPVGGLTDKQKLDTLWNEHTGHISQPF